MALRTEHLTYVYSEGTAYEKTAVSDVTLTFPEGQFIGIIGHTGSGKSTLIQHLNGLLKATGGAVLDGDQDIFGEGYRLKDLRGKVGLVFQYPEHQLFEETVFADVLFGPKNLGLSEEEASDRARKALRAVGLDESFYDKSPFDLSGGQKRRVAIAGILAMHPSYLILDEPTAGLDPKGRTEILDLAASLHRENGITVILVSHSMEDVAVYVQRIIVMDKGQVAYDGTPREVFSHYRELEQMGLGAPQVTYLAGDLKKKGWPIEGTVTTIPECADAIMDALRRG